MLLESLITILFCTLISSTCVVASPSSPDSGALVNIRIEGLNRTIFDGEVFTRGHNVTTKSGGTLHCDGTNNGANPTPGPTATSALDDASKVGRFTFDGTIFEGFDDFLITRIGWSANTDTEFWGLLLNFNFTSVGGCQQRVQQGDHILWAFNAFDKEFFLKLEVEGSNSGVVTVQLGDAVTLKVTDGTTGVAMGNATIEENGIPILDSGDAGEIKIETSKRGVFELKAERSDSIRSNTATIVVV